MCDCLVALGPATAEGVTLFAKNSDRPPDEVQVLERFGARRDDGTLRVTHIEIDPLDRPTLEFVGSRPAWMWGVEHGVNAASVAVGNATIYTTLDPRGFPPALTGMDLVRLALERATSASGAVETIAGLIERYGQGGSGHEGADRPYWSSFLIADPSSGFVVETSGRTIAVESVDRTRAISNRTTIPTFDAVHRHPNQPVAELVDPRLAAGEERPAGEPVTAAALMGHLASHRGGDGGWTVCMHVPGIEATTASIVAELREPEAGGPVLHVAQGPPCRTDYERVTLGTGPAADPVE